MVEEFKWEFLSLVRPETEEEWEGKNVVLEQRGRCKYKDEAVPVGRLPTK